MKNLLGRLMSRPFEELKVIANAWGTINRDQNPTHNDLAIAVYHTMVERSATRNIWENLEPDARAFLGWLLNQRNMLALVDDLPAQFARPEEEVTPILDWTRRLGLVDVDEVMVRGTRVVSSGDNLYAWAPKNQAEAVKRRVVSIAAEEAKILRDIIDESKRPPPFDEPFAALLEGLDQEEIQRIAATWKLPETTRYYKSELIGVMSEFLAAGQGRQLLISTLSLSSQKLLEHVEKGGGAVRAAEARRHFHWDDREMRAAVAPLVQRALVWDVLVGEKRFLFVPQDLLNRSSGGNETAPIMQPKLVAPAPHTIESRLPYEMPWDMLTLLATGLQGELQLTLQDSRITKRVAKRINDAFLHPADIKSESEYIDMVVHLARSLGLLVEQQGEQVTLALAPKAEEWSKLSFEAQRRRLYGLWQEDRKWAEPATYGTIYWWNSDLTGARKRLAKHLLGLTAGEWINLDGFLRRIQLIDPFLIWSQDELVKRFGLRALQGFRSHWFEIEGRIIADMLRTMLNWLGAVEIGRDKQRRFISFRVTPEGQALFAPANGHKAEGSSQKGEEAAQATPQIQNPKSKIQNSMGLMVQPNFEVLVLHPESAVVWNLLRMSDLVRHDRVSVYTINKESVVRAVESGLTGEEIKGFLEANTGKALPQNVAHSIADWERLIKRLDIVEVTIVEVADPTVLDELMASRKTKRYITRRLTPTIAIAALPPASESGRESPAQRLLKELRGAGYFPRIANPSAGNGSNSELGNAPEKVSTAKGSPARGRAASTRTSKSEETTPQFRTGTR
ncbi:MAG TPA: helicase-associated domain-containing protein [Chloroflexia bacterium]|nr:helicase-associated domain-containing protein [Chloroflexia bacterium]